jgi:hypothetical protein
VLRKHRPAGNEVRGESRKVTAKTEIVNENALGKIPMVETKKKQKKPNRQRSNQKNKKNKPETLKVR